MPNKVLFGPEKIASSSQFGIIKTGDGLYVSSTSNKLNLGFADTATIKTGTHSTVVISAARAGDTAFYGLAKAAGDSTQAASSNAVGVYTDNAKMAIQNMLSVAPTASPIFSGSITLGTRYSVSQGINNKIGENSLAIGYYVDAMSYESIAIGNGACAWEPYSFAMGGSTYAWGQSSFAFGEGIVAVYPFTVAIGHYNVGTSIPDWATNTSYSVGDIVYSGSYTYRCKTAHTSSGDTFSKGELWENEFGDAFVVGNGQSGSASNALTLHNSGRLSIKGNMYVNANADGSGGTRVPHDIQINGTSIVSNGVANIPIAAIGTLGAVSWDGDYGISANASGRIYVNKATSTQIPLGTAQYRPIVPYNQHEAVFYGLAKAAGDTTQASSSNSVGYYTLAARSKIYTMLNTPVRVTDVATLIVEAQPGTSYIFGEMTSITFTAPETGCVDLLFKSGSTPTTLTITSAKSGVSAIKWANDFDPTTIEANATYEINILDGEYGVACKWT